MRRDPTVPRGYIDIAYDPCAERGAQDEDRAMGSHKELSVILGVTPQRANQLITKAVRKLWRSRDVRQRYLWLSEAGAFSLRERSNRGKR